MDAIARRLLAWHPLAPSALAGATAWVGVRAALQGYPVETHPGPRAHPSHEHDELIPQMLPLGAAFGTAVLIYIVRERFMFRR